MRPAAAGATPFLLRSPLAFSQLLHRAVVQRITRLLLPTAYLNLHSATGIGTPRVPYAVRRDCWCLPLGVWFRELSGSEKKYVNADGAHLIAWVRVLLDSVQPIIQTQRCRIPSRDLLLSFIYHIIHGLHMHVLTCVYLQAKTLILRRRCAWYK